MKKTARIIAVCVSFLMVLTIPCTLPSFIAGIAGAGIAVSLSDPLFWLAMLSAYFLAVISFPVGLYWMMVNTYRVLAYFMR